MEKYWKYVCWMLTLVCIVLVVIIWHDHEIDRLKSQLNIQTQISNNMAVALSQVNNMLPENSNLVPQINHILAIPYPQLVREKKLEEIPQEDKE